MTRLLSSAGRLFAAAFPALAAALRQNRAVRLEYRRRLAVDMAVCARLRDAGFRCEEKVWRASAGYCVLVEWRGRELERAFGGYGRLIFGAASSERFNRSLCFTFAGELAGFCTGKRKLVGGSPLGLLPAGWWESTAFLALSAATWRSSSEEELEMRLATGGYLAP